MIQVPQQLQVVTGGRLQEQHLRHQVLSGAAQARCFLLLKEDVVFFAPVLAPLEQQIIVDPMLTIELRYGDLWSMREVNHFDFELNGIIRAFFSHCG